MYNGGQTFVLLKIISVFLSNDPQEKTNCGIDFLMMFQKTHNYFRILNKLFFLKLFDHFSTLL
jgi:hypothetical protein